MTIKKAVLVLVLILTLLTGWIYVTGEALEKTLLDEDFHKRVLAETDGENLQQYFLEAAPPELKSYSFWDESMIYKALVHTADEAWLKEQAAIFIEEYLAFIKGEQEELIVRIDLSERRSIFIEELKYELDRSFPELSEVISPEIIDELLSRLEIPETLNLIEIDDRADLDPEFKAEIALLEQIRTFLRAAPWFCIAALALISIFWFSPAGTFKIIGLGLLFSGVIYMYLWPLGWEYYVYPYIDSLIDQPLLEMIWSKEADTIFNRLEVLINQDAWFVSGAGLLLYLIGLIGQIVNRLIK